MRSLFWNVRGIGKSARRLQLNEYIFNEKIDCVGIQETEKKDFSPSELREMSRNADFIWKWIPAVGMSGGIIMGFNNENLEIEDCILGVFSIATSLRNRKTNFWWVQVTVYGPASHDHSDKFLEELAMINRNSQIPVLFGGDFNLIREAKHKNNNNINMGLVRSFNKFIEEGQFREIRRAGSRYTWTNKQDDPILVNLDRILVPPSWELKNPLANARSITRVGSDHSPIILDDGEKMPCRQKNFFFEKQWLLLPEFR